MLALCTVSIARQAQQYKTWQGLSMHWEGNEHSRVTSDAGIVDIHHSKEGKQAARI